MKIKLFLKPKPKKVEVKNPIEPPVILQKKIKLVQPPKPVLQKKVKEELPADIYKPVGTPQCMTAVDDDIEYKIYVSINRQGDMGLPVVDICEVASNFAQKELSIPLQIYPQFVDMLCKTLNQQEVQKALQDLKPPKDFY